MLIEWLKHATTPCPRHLREMGYLREAIALDARRRRHRRAWRPHVEACHDVIRASAGACRRKDRAVILGSGPLYDIPLRDLSRSFKEVILVDLIHLPEAGAKARRCKNVHLMNRDVTGVVEAVHRIGAGEVPLAGADLPLEGADMVVSANLLSQLPLLPAAWLEGQGQGQDATSFARALVTDHLAALGAFPGVACLITEVERRMTDGGRVLGSEDPLWGVAPPSGGREWTWAIAPRPEVSPDYDLGYRMRGIADLNHA